MERKIGEIFEHNGEWYQCIEGEECSNCYFNNKKCYTLRGNDNNDIIGSCIAYTRSDRKGVVFKKLEKVGEPVKYNGSLYQGFKAENTIIDVCLNCAFWEINCGEAVICDTNVFFKRIKQNKEEMEENRIINQHSAECEQTINDVVRKCYTENKSTQIKDMKEKMRMHDLKEDMPKSNKAFDEFLYSKQELKLKPFSLELAKQGKPVCTRDGRKARIICFDTKAKKPIAALITNDDTEEVHFYYDNGRSDQYQEYRYDLMMLPEKKEGWAVIYKDDLLRTEKEARELAEQSISEVIRIEKIEWEE